MVDAPGQQFIFSLYDVGDLLYETLIADDGRYYIAGLFGEDGLALLDLWRPEQDVRRILDGFGRGEEKLPMYKMPHLGGGQTYSGSRPTRAHGRPAGWTLGLGQFRPPVERCNPGHRCADPAIAHEFTPGEAIMHLEFTPRGEQVWISVRDENRVDIYDTRTLERLSSIETEKPSGFFLPPAPIASDCKPWIERPPRRS